MIDSQKKVKDIVKNYNLNTSIETRLLDLSSEVGELAKEVLKGTNYGKDAFKETDSFQEGLGDVFFSLLTIANIANIDIKESLDTVLVKYEKRFKNNGSIDSEGDI